MQVKQLKDIKGKNDIPNTTRIKLADDSLSPVAEAGDSVVVAQLMSPQDGDLVAYQYKDKYFVRWWRLAESEMVVTDADENEERLSLDDVLIIGVAVEVRRPISRGRTGYTGLIGLINVVAIPFVTL